MIIPITGKISWRNPPAVTIAIILINIVIFFAFLSKDAEIYGKAFDYYVQSGLAEIELRHYVKYAAIKGKKLPPAFEEESPGEKETMAMYHTMLSDREFSEDLEKDQVITVNDPDYESWKKLKANYNDVLNQRSGYRFGFIPSHVTPVSIISHMFMHGGFGHLFGNMVFLWLVGCILEMGCGRLLYAVWYIIGGFAAVGLYWCFNLSSTVPLVGASGAISGLMGLVTVLYGAKKIKVFLTLGFYFDYFKMPGILLLPIWVVTEIFYQVTSGDTSNVAYMAHAGGLMGGAVLGMINLKLIGLHDEHVFEEEPVDTLSPWLVAAIRSIEALDFDAARIKLNQLLTQAPDNLSAMVHLFHIEKLEPENEKFHNISRKLIFSLCRNPVTHDKAKAFFREYMALTSKPKLTPDLFLKLSLVFLGSGDIDQAEIMVKTLLKKRSRMEGLPAAILKLVNALEKSGNKEKSRHFREIILSEFPDTHEALILRSS
ncbi:MAG: rhomboid family intramembrane serine protease [Desulfosalsimonadaceae bacterium]|nr:rhomboid family intramembrane serine protease [Desulfosalsimonadaceae bacterium]